MGISTTFAQFSAYATLKSKELEAYKPFLKVDIWSKKTSSFLGATAHVICPDTFKRKSFPIACERFPGKHDYLNCGRMIMKVHDDMGLTVDKVVDCNSGIVTFFISFVFEFYQLRMDK